MNQPACPCAWFFSVKLGLPLPHAWAHQCIPEGPHLSQARFPKVENTVGGFLPKHNGDSLLSYSSDVTKPRRK